MYKIAKIIPWVVIPLIFVVIGVLMQGKSIAVLQPAGQIAAQQRDLLLYATLLILIVVIPVFVLAFTIAWRYRETNPKSAERYHPELDGDKRMEAVWWGIPLVIIGVLSVMIWTSSHNLDPYKPLASNKEAFRVQVVAMKYKWLFIYPEQDIASVNHLKIPVGRPVEFDVTSDAPMNSFWIPRLGGQVYAMAGMNTKLHLIADQKGTFRGSSANISGEGFADMHFSVEAISPSELNAWARGVRQNNERLSVRSYSTLARPGTVESPRYYSLGTDNLYDTILAKYMHPGGHEVTAPAKHSHKQSGGRQHDHGSQSADEYHSHTKVTPEKEHH
ncbi:ubiquinol oxidase subunit II [Candidatus Saccharibacteria bacterium]|nr:ubiquinol oxidase subunit II [Candidatus Saccharibacteria bacterium]